MSQDQDKHVAAGDDRKDAWRGQDKGFRGRENGQGQPSDDFDDDADLPSLNRKRGGNKLITAAGYVFMALLAVAAIVAVNRNPSAPVKKGMTARSRTACQHSSFRRLLNPRHRLHQKLR